MNTITTAQLRQTFLNYFECQGHAIVFSSSLLPVNDPTLLFVNAGMVQFKDLFLGKEKRKYTRAVTVQRCMRASGKHNDLENVGYTTRHHTFFEMLGNFSFGDYFKREAIHFAWEFLTKELGIDSKRLWVTVHKNDSEAEKLWREEFAASNKEAQGLSGCDDKDNFWAMGDTGPCGYCSEIYYDHGANIPGDPPGGPNEGERYVEIWNLVFMQFERDSSGKLSPLPKPSVDTGMGLERIAAVMQGVHDNYEIDIFQEIYKKFQTEYQHLQNKLQAQEVRTAMRIIADHVRAVVFLLADGVIPSNEGRGYVLRSILRRVVYHLYKLGIDKPALFAFVAPVVEIMGPAYPELELAKRQADITATVEDEERKFIATLDRGVKILEQAISELKDKIIPGELVFTLHDTYGFPAILTAEIARQRGLTIDQAGFDVAMEKQREMSRAASKFKVDETLKIALDGSTEFVGYTQTSCKSKIRGIFTADGKPLSNVTEQAKGIIVLDKTPFYAESGGQVGDTGTIHLDNVVFVVQNTLKYGAHYLHFGMMSRGSLGEQATVTAEIDAERRQAIKLNHSATHLLHRSLHLTVGEHAMQRGSLVEPNRLRFDFVHSAPLTTTELYEIEQLVNAKIRANLSVNTAIKSFAEAKNESAIALFGEKYGDEVRIVTMGDFSKELCGGTHVNATGDIGFFKITAEMSIGAGLRRIEAVTGEAAVLWAEAYEAQLTKIAGLLAINGEQVIDKLTQLIEDRRTQEKELGRLKQELAVNKGKNIAAQAITVGEIKVLAAQVENIEGNALRQTVDNLKQQLQTAVIVLAVNNNDKIQLIAGVSKNLTAKIKANELLQYVAKQIGGTGGGRDDMAQGGGTNIAALPQALTSVTSWVEKKLLSS